MAILDFDVSGVDLSGENGTAISLTGSIDATTNQQFEQELTDILTQGVKKVILILKGIKYINSTGLGTIVKCVDTFREAGGDIKMVGIPTKVIALFEMLGLLALFETFDTVDEAMISFSEEEADAGPKRVKAEYPIQLKCSSCSAGINMRSAGKYKCPKCGDYFSAEEDGTVETYAIRKPNVIQLQIPCDRRFSESVKLMSISSAGRFGMSEADLTSISSSIETVFASIADGNPLPNDNINILVVNDEKKFSIGFVDYGSLLNIDENSPEIATLEGYMDQVEYISLSSKGSLLKMNKLITG